MSGINGDKARFHRERKQKIAKRKRTRELVRLSLQPDLARTSSTSKPPTVKA